MSSLRLIFITSAAVAVSSIAAAAPLYDIKPLASTGTPDVFPKGVNDSGQVVGFSVDSNGLSHAVIWQNGSVSELAYNDNSEKSSEAYRINNAGQIVGKAKAPNGSFQASYWNPAGAITNIGTVGGASSFANDINDLGVVAGSSTASVGSHAFTWTQSGGFVDYSNNLPTSPLGQAGWNGISNSGLVAGTSYTIFSPYKAAMAHPGDRNPTQISPAGQFSTGMALAVNDNDVIVGYQNGGTGAPKAAIFDGRGGFTPLGSLGLSDSWAMDINNAGVIVGTAFGDDGNGLIQKSFVYTDSTMFSLSDVLVDGSGWTTLFEASSISSNGLIIGSGIYNGEVRGFIATPVPEPASIALIGLVGVSMRRRRI